MYSIITYTDSEGEDHIIKSTDLGKGIIEAHPDGKIVNTTRFDIQKIVSVETVEE